MAIPALVAEAPLQLFSVCDNGDDLARTFRHPFRRTEGIRENRALDIRKSDRRRYTVGVRPKRQPMSGGFRETRQAVGR